MVSALNVLTATIAASASLSDAVEIGHRSMIGILMPAAWTTAVLTFQVSVDGSTFVDVYDHAVEKSVAAGASRWILLDPSSWVGLPQLKVRSGTAATPVSQAAARTLKLYVRDFD